MSVDPRPFRGVVLIVAAMALAHGQSPDPNLLHRVEGRVMRGTRAGPRPLANQWVVVHRVGRDRSGPLDSTRTGADGRYALRYRVAAADDTTALYFATTSYDGIVYPTAPLRAPVVSGDDATLTVFDTTSGPVEIKVGGRHFIIGAPQANGRRPVAEVYDLSNDSTVTAVSRDSTTPVWSTHIPPQAAGFQVNMSTELATTAVTRAGSTVSLFAPLSPGIRQLAFTYELPSDAFPLSVPMERPTDVLEILVQEPTATVGLAGVTLREVAPVTTEGRAFRRYLARDVPASAVIRFTVPHIVGAEREKVYAAVGAVVLASMLIALAFAARRSAKRPASVRTSAPIEPRSESLLRAIVTLDEEFERDGVSDSTARAEYEVKRAALKEQLSHALAGEREAT